MGVGDAMVIVVMVGGAAVIGGIPPSNMGVAPSNLGGRGAATHKIWAQHFVVILFNLAIIKFDGFVL